MSNCGVIALGEMTSLKNVSMFTLIHMAKDNGLHLYFCHVSPEQLLEVARPAIFHQKQGHFISVEDGEPLPDGDYSGYVLTTKAMNEPLPHSLAKKIHGQTGGSSNLVGAVVTGIASVINPFLGAAVGAGFGYKAYKDTGDWWRIPLGAATGYLQGVPLGSTFGVGNAALAGGLAAAGEIPGALKTGNWLAPVTAGLGQYAGANLIGGIQGGIAGAGAGASLTSKIAAGAQGGLGAIKAGAQKLAGGEIAGQAPGGGGIQSTSQAFGSTPAGYSGTYSIPGIGNSVVGLPGGSGPAGFSAANAANLASGASNFVQPATGAAGGWASKLFSGASGLKLLGTVASTGIKPPQLEGNVQDNYSKAAQYLGVDNYTALPSATRQQLETYVNTPLEDLAKQFYKPDDKSIRSLEEAKQKQIDALMVQYANYGQDPYTSTEAQRQLMDINRQYDQAISEQQQQMQNAAMDQAISFKKEMLQKSMEQGEFDYNTAMELATYIGRDQELKYAMESQNHEQLQDVLSEIFSFGSDLLKTY